MKNKLKIIAGFLWSLPVSLILFILHILPFWSFGWYEFLGWEEKAFMWQTTEKLPAVLQKWWQKRSGITFGSLIVFKRQISGIFLKHAKIHQLEHAHQYHILGIFYPIIYFIIFISLKLTGSINAHDDNSFEISAKRRINEYIFKNSRKISN